MTTSLHGHFAACQALAERFAAVTGGHARAELMPQPEGGVILKYLKGCCHFGESAYETVYEDQLSLLRALDSLTLHVARALRANAEGLELASLTLDSAGAAQGIVHLGIYCPAWHHPHSIPCRYDATTIPNGKHVLLEPVGPNYLTAEQGIGWDRLYDGGLVTHMPTLLPVAAQALAQLFMVNESFNLDARKVLLPGEHRQYTGHAENGIVLMEFESKPGFWNIYPQGNVLLVATPAGPMELPLPRVRELNAALARWQALGELLGDSVREEL